MEAFVYDDESVDGEMVICCRRLRSWSGDGGITPTATAGPAVGAWLSATSSHECLLPPGSTPAAASPSVLTQSAVESLYHALT
jgi:hypothetical protein